ncbi:unnamed protein product, partial [Symbiodinium pilosum]
AERRAEQHFQKMIFLVTDSVLGAKVLISAHTTTDDVCIRVEGNRQQIEDMIKERMRQHKLTAAHYKHHQYRRSVPDEPPLGK